MEEPFKGGWLKAWVEASSLVAAVLYAFGWIFAARLFARFGVTPEEAGYSFAFLLIRVVFLVGALWVLVVLVVWALNRLARYSGARRVNLSIGGMGITATWLNVLLAVIATLFAGWALWRGFEGDDQEASGVSGVGASALVVSLVASAFAVLLSRVARQYERVRSTEPRIGISLKSALRIISYGFALFAIVAVLAVPFLTADRFADQIESGRELRAPILPGIAGLAIQKVQVTAIDGESISPRSGDSACLHLLGSSGGMIVLYDHESDSVIRVPQGRVSLEDPCN